MMDRLTDLRAFFIANRLLAQVVQEEVTRLERASVETADPLALEMLNAELSALNNDLKNRYLIEQAWFKSAKGRQQVATAPVCETCAALRPRSAMADGPANRRLAAIWG